MIASVPEVLFVCVHNAGRSQMAAALLEHHGAGRVRHAARLLDASGCAQSFINRESFFAVRLICIPLLIGISVQYFRRFESVSVLP